MKTTRNSLLLAVLGLGLIPSLASAHILPGDPAGFHHGFSHPFAGIDHLLAMMAVGLWAAQQGGRAVWLVPLTFVGVMTLGGVLGMTSAHLPAVEMVIAGSVLTLGCLIATAARFSLSGSALIVGFFALFHGFAHGKEMPVSSSAILFSVGFILATVLLHIVGMSVGLKMRQNLDGKWLRLAGAAMAIYSITLFVA